MDKGKDLSGVRHWRPSLVCNLNINEIIKKIKIIWFFWTCLLKQKKHNEIKKKTKIFITATRNCISQYKSWIRGVIQTKNVSWSGKSPKSKKMEAGSALKSKLWTFPLFWTSIVWIAPLTNNSISLLPTYTPITCSRFPGFNFKKWTFWLWIFYSLHEKDTTLFLFLDISYIDESKPISTNWVLIRNYQSHLCFVY